MALLPEKLPELPNLQIAVYMKTATEVGGDYYDFNISADGTLNVAMGDATGHGVADVFCARVAIRQRCQIAGRWIAAEQAIIIVVRG